MAASPRAHTQQAAVLQPGDDGRRHTTDLAGQDKRAPHVSIQHLLLRVLGARGL